MRLSPQNGATARTTRFSLCHMPLRAHCLLCLLPAATTRLLLRAALPLPPRLPLASLPAAHSCRLFRCAPLCSFCLLFLPDYSPPPRTTATSLRLPLLPTLTSPSRTTHHVYHAAAHTRRHCARQGYTARAGTAHGRTLGRRCLYAGGAHTCRAGHSPTHTRTTHRTGTRIPHTAHGHRRFTLDGASATASAPRHASRWANWRHHPANKHKRKHRGRMARRGCAASKRNARRI